MQHGLSRAVFFSFVYSASEMEILPTPVANKQSFGCDRGWAKTDGSTFTAHHSTLLQQASQGRGRDVRPVGAVPSPSSLLLRVLSLLLPCLFPLYRQHSSRPAYSLATTAHSFTHSLGASLLCPWSGLLVLPLPPPSHNYTLRFLRFLVKMAWPASVLLLI